VERVSPGYMCNQSASEAIKVVRRDAAGLLSFRDFYATRAINLNVPASLLLSIFKMDTALEHLCSPCRTDAARTVMAEGRRTSIGRLGSCRRVGTADASSWACAFHGSKVGAARVVSVGPSVKQLLDIKTSIILCLDA
jgi:hypothetical protein